MQKFILILGIIMMTSVNAAAGPLSSSASKSGLYRLANGLTVIIHEDRRFPLVSMRLYVHAGSAYETPQEAGISHLLEHMVFQGTEKRASGKTAGEVEALGGYINASTSFDYTVYTADLPAEHWRTGLDVLKDMAFHARIGEEELASEKKVVIAELKRNEDNPLRFLFTRLQAGTLAGTPYARPIIGYEEVINRISRQDILNYVAELYQPQSMLLAVAGNIDSEALRAEIEKIYGSIPARKGYVFPESIAPDSLPSAGPAVKIHRGRWNKVYLGLAFPSIGQRDARSVHLDVLTSLLGGGKTSYLYRKYKYELRLVDSIAFENYSFERLGLLYFSIVLDEDKFMDFWREFSKDLAGIDDIKFTEEELNRVKLNLEDSLFRAKETLSGLTEKIGYFAFFDQPEKGEENYLYNLRQTSLEDLSQQLESVSGSRLSVVLLLPEENKDITEQTVKNILTERWPLSDAAAPEDMAEKTSPALEVLELGRGRTLILRPDDTLPYISGSLMFSGGDALLDKDSQGLASLAASTLTKGAADLEATDVEDYLADRASSLLAGAGRQSFFLSFTSPSRFNQDIFHLLEVTLRDPHFAPAEFNRARQNQIAAIRYSEDQPLSLAFRHLFPFLFKEHPYGFLQLGTEQGLDGFTVELAKSFWERQKEQPWVLSVCGSFDREEVIAAARNLPSPATGSRQLSLPEWSEEKSLALSLPGRKQSHILLVFPTAPLGDGDIPGLQLLRSVLSGMSGLLFTELRDRQGLGYTVAAIPWNSQKAGLLIFYIGTEPGKTAQAKKGFTEVVEKLRQAPLPDELLERGKNSLRGEYYMDMQSLGARSSESATLFLLGLPLDSAQKQIEAAAEITPAELHKLARKYLNLEKAYWLEVHP
jgi:zinc protease